MISLKCLCYLKTICSYHTGFHHSPKNWLLCLFYDGGRTQSVPNSPLQTKSFDPTILHERKQGPKKKEIAQLRQFCDCQDSAGTRVYWLLVWASFLSAIMASLQGLQFWAPRSFWDHIQPHAKKAAYSLVASREATFLALLLFCVHITRLN